MLTRRNLLKSCAAAGGAIWFSADGPVARSFADNPQSPSTTPFLDELPLPPSPTASVQPFAQLPPKANLFFDPTGQKGVANFYSIVAEDRSVHFHHQLPPTPIWGYRDASVPVWNYAFGPTFVSHISGNQFSGNFVRLQNQLKPDATGFGVPQLTTHLHGGHHPSRFDGFPGDIILDGAAFNPLTPPGSHADHIFPLLDPGHFSDLPDPAERPSTQWYHDHALDFTAPNVYRGLAGLFLVYEDPKAPGARDLGDENDSRGLRLPSGAFDVPIAIQDKLFAQDGALVFDPFNHDGLLGDKFIVNGKIQPYQNVKARRYRYRLLNGSSARFYGLCLTNSAGKAFPMTVIATEGGLLSRSVPNVTNLLMAPAERLEVIVDFSMFQENEKVYLEDRLVQVDGRGPSGTFEQPEFLNSGTRLVEFRVQEKVADPSVDLTGPSVPLRPCPPVSAQDLAKAHIREFVFERSHGAWTINGQLADLSNSMAAPVVNAPEIWRLKNNSGGWWHPIHIHSEFQRVLTRNGKRPALLEQDGIARKDTVVLGPDSEVEVFLRFRDYVGPWVFHCHNLQHEDMAMMARFDVVPEAGKNNFV